MRLWYHLLQASYVTHRMQTCSLSNLRQPWGCDIIHRRSLMWPTDCRDAISRTYINYEVVIFFVAGVLGDRHNAETLALETTSTTSLSCCLWQDLQDTPGTVLVFNSATWFHFRFDVHRCIRGGRRGWSTRSLSFINAATAFVQVVLCSFNIQNIK